MRAPLLVMLMVPVLLLLAAPPALPESIRLRVQAASVAAAPPADVPPEAPLSWMAELESVAGWLRRSSSTAVAWLGNALSPPNPEDVARRIERKDSELWALIEDAGYRLSNVETALGFIPSAKATFRLARELSAVDREQLEERLERYAESDGGLAARLHREILRILLDGSESGTHRIDKVEISLWPLPRAEFSLTLTDGEKTEAGAPVSAAP